MNLRILLKLGVLLLLSVACSRNDADGRAKSVNITFRAQAPSGPAVPWRAGERIRVYQICKDEIKAANGTIRSVNDDIIEFSTSFEKADGKEYSYSCLYPSPVSLNSNNVSIRQDQLVSGVEAFPMDGCVLYSEATVPIAYENGKQEDVEFSLKRYGTVCHLKINDVDKDKIQRIQISFPANVAGTLTFNPIAGDFSRSNESKAIKAFGKADDFIFCILPSEFAKDSEVSLDLSYSSVVYPCKWTFPSAYVPDSGETIEMSITPDLKVLFNNPVKREDWPDPTIWRDGTMFYTLATGTNRTIWRSADLLNWTNTGKRAQTVSDTQEAQKVGGQFWAPDMVKIGNYWNLYISLYNSAQDSGIGLFRSTNPTGPFAWYGVITHSKTNGGIKDSIDPEVVVDPETGKVWLFFGSVGKVHRVELNSEGTALAPGAGYVHVAGVDVNVNSNRSKVFEGTYLYKRGDWWYLFASAGLYSNYTYRTVVGRSRTLTGEFLDKEGRRMAEGYASDLIVSSNGDAFYGPGHNGEIFTDSTGQDYILYHCHNNSINGNTGHRFMMLQRLFWDENGWPYVQDGKPAVMDIAPKF